MSGLLGGARPKEEFGPCGLRAIPVAIQMASGHRLPDGKITLHARSRLKPSLDLKGGLLKVEEGVVALEASPVGGRRQILDFLLAEDTIPGGVLSSGSSCFLRAITEATLTVSVPDEVDGSERMPTLLDQFQSHAERCNLHRIIIGQLDTEARVASFLLALASRAAGSLSTNLLIELPMSRDDIADYLSINPDTLSRVMMRFETSGMIHRVNRHAVMLVSPAELGRHTPLKSQILSVSAGPIAAGRGAPPMANGPDKPSLEPSTPRA